MSSYVMGCKFPPKLNRTCHQLTHFLDTVYMLAHRSANVASLLL